MTIPEPNPDLSTSGPQVATSLPCPGWCDRPTGHALQSAVDLDLLAWLAPEASEAIEAAVTASIETDPTTPLYRVHRRRFGARATHVAVETYERTAGAAGPSDLGTDPEATVVRVQLPSAHGYLTPTGARRLADLLREAADLAERQRQADES